MHAIICPHCSKAFKIDEAGYADILKQVLMRANAHITAEELGAKLGITKRAVLKQIEKLKGQNRFARVGPARGGHWQVLNTAENPVQGKT